MTLLAAFIEVLFPVAVVVAAGFALRRAFPIDLQSLNRVSLYVLSPALIFVTLARITVTGDEALRIAAASVLIILGMGCLTWLYGRFRRIDHASMAALLLCTMFMNAGNFGLSTTRFAFGDPGLQRALLFFIPQSIMAQVLAVPIARSGAGNRSGSWRQILRMPQIYAAAAGLLIALSGIHLDGRKDVFGSLFQGIVLLSEAAIPLLLLLLGMQLAVGIMVEERELTIAAVVFRLLVSPPLAYAVALLLGLHGVSLAVVVLEASMPTAVNMVVFAMEFGARPRVVASVVVISTLLSLLTLSVLLTLLRT